MKPAVYAYISAHHGDSSHAFVTALRNRILGAVCTNVPLVQNGKELLFQTLPTVACGVDRRIQPHTHPASPTGQADGVGLHPRFRTFGRSFVRAYEVRRTQLEMRTKRLLPRKYPHPAAVTVAVTAERPLPVLKCSYEQANRCCEGLRYTYTVTLQNHEQEHQFLPCSITTRLLLRVKAHPYRHLRKENPRLSQQVTRT